MLESDLQFDAQCIQILEYRQRGCTPLEKVEDMAKANLHRKNSKLS